MSHRDYYSDDESIDIRFERRRSPPPPAPPVQYVQRPRQYHPADNSHIYLEPERTSMMRARSRSRDRSRDRHSSVSAAPAAAPVVIYNRVSNDYSSDSDSDRRDRHLKSPRSRRRSRSTSRTPSHMMSREEYEMERARRELEELKLTRQREEQERRTAKDLQEEQELKRAKKELEEIKRRRAQEEDEKRIRRDLDLKRLKEEEEEAEEKKLREKEAAEAVERYKQKETLRLQKEAEDKIRQEKEYQRRLQDHLIQSGLNDQQITAILKKEKVPDSRPRRRSEHRVEEPEPNRATYTRMARKHLSLETLRTFEVEYSVDDSDANYVLIKRWVPKWEQDALWKHTKVVREKRSKLILTVDDKKSHHHHHGHDGDFEWVRKKSDRRRSKSPSLLMYLAGVKPA